MTPLGSVAAAMGQQSAPHVLSQLHYTNTLSSSRGAEVPHDALQRRCHNHLGVRYTPRCDAITRQK
jgi:hypothetical protein